MRRARRLPKPSPGTILAIVAVVLASSGTALAAHHYLITSTRQISPKVLKRLRGKPGPRGATGLTGPAGVVGAGGSQGPAGPQGPGATQFVWKTTSIGTESSPAIEIGRIGPWTIYARCVTNSGGELQAITYFSGEAATLDEVGSEAEKGKTETFTVGSLAVNAVTPSAPRVFASLTAESAKQSSLFGSMILDFAGGANLALTVGQTASNGPAATTPFCRLVVEGTPVKSGAGVSVGAGEAAIRPAASARRVGVGLRPGRGLLAAAPG